MSSTLLRSGGEDIPGWSPTSGCECLTASGRAILADLPAVQVRALHPSRAGLVKRTPAGAASLAELRAILAATRRRGYAEEDSEITEGFASVAVSLRPPANLASVAITWESPLQLEPAQVLEHLRAAAGTIEARLR